MLSLSALQEMLRARRQGQAMPASGSVSDLARVLRARREERRAGTARRLLASLALLDGPAGAPTLRREYGDLPDRGRVQLGRAMTGDQPSIAIHHRPGRPMRSLDLLDGHELQLPMVTENPSPNEDDLVLLAALAADMGSAQARAAYAAVPPAPPAPPPLSNRAVTIGHWELLHDRNAGTIRICRAHLMGPIIPDERSALTRLGLEADLWCARGPHTAERWEQVKAWAQRARASIPSAEDRAPHAPPASTRVPVAGWTRPPLSRKGAAERIAALLRLRSYTAEVVAPGHDTGSIRVVVGREQDPRTLGRHDDKAVGAIWLMLDGRLRIAPAGARYATEVARELERLAAEALKGEPITPTPRAVEQEVGPLHVMQDDAGGWVVRDVEGRERGETFATEAEAVAYARRVGPLRAPQGLADVAAHIAPPASAIAAGVTFDPRSAEIRSWVEGAPRVVMPFEIRDDDDDDGDGQVRRGELLAIEDVTKEAPGHISYLRVWIDDETGKRWGASTLSERDHRESPWVREMMGKLLAALPVQAVDFDGARVEPTDQGMLVRFDEEPSEHARSALRRGKFRRADPRSWIWVRDRTPDAWWWARHVAAIVQREREHARAADRAPQSFTAPASHRTFEAREALQAARASLAARELLVRSETRRLLRAEDPERAAWEVRGLLAERDQLHELVRLYRDDGSRRRMGEDGPEMRDFRAPLPERPTRVARGIELWERGGRIYVRLGAEPSEWLAETLRTMGFGRSRKQDEERTWWQASRPLASYWAHWLAEQEAERDATPEFVGRRFAGALPAESPLATQGTQTTQDTHATRGAPSRPRTPARAPELVVTMPMKLGERAARLAEAGQDATTWEAAARVEFGSEDDAEGDRAIEVVRDRILTIDDGRIVGDDWLAAFKRAWGSARGALLAARLFADQPLVVAAAEVARARRERAEQPRPPEDADLIPTEVLEALMPAGLSKAEQQRGRRALGDALVALGLAERQGYEKKLHARRPVAASSAWGWLLRHEMRRDHRAEAPEAWALRESLAARLLGYGEDDARFAMDAAYAEGWVKQSLGAGAARVLLVEEPAR